MSIDRQPQQRKRSYTLLVTFLLGILIGLGLHYALVVAMPDAGPFQRFSGGAEEAAPAGQTEEARRRMPPDVNGVWPGRHLIMGIAGPTLSPVEAELLQRYVPGGVVLREQNLVNPAQIRELVSDIKHAVGRGVSLSDLPLIVLAHDRGPMYDLLGIEGAIMPARLGDMNDPGVARQAAHRYAAALRDLGIGATLGPVLDIYNPGLSEPGLALAAFSTDKNTVSAIGVSFAEGMREAGVVPVIKHFPGMGDAVFRPDGSRVIETEDTRVLVDLIFPFSRAAAQRLPGIMVGNVAVPLIDHENPEVLVPATHSTKLIQALLREQFEFDGAVVAADMTLDPMMRGRHHGEAVVQALEAGCDAVVLYQVDAADLEEVSDAIFAAVDEKRLSLHGLESSKARLDVWRSLLDADPQFPAREEAPVTIATAVVDAMRVRDQEPEHEPQRQSFEEIEHVVQPGDTLLRIASRYGVAMEQIKTWNSLRGDVIHPGQRLTLRSPRAEVAQEVVTPEAESQDEEQQAEAAPEPVPPPPDTELVEHQVAAGETLPEIAARHGLLEEDILQWNALSQAQIEEGSILRLYVARAHEETASAPETGAETDAGSDAADPAVLASLPESPPESAVSIEEDADQDTQEVNGTPTRVAEAPSPAPKAAPAPQRELDTYTVKPGDNLRRIADNAGTTQQELVRLNNLKDPNHIVVGQRLQVPRRRS